MDEKNHEVMTCTCCGKEIPKGEKIYYIRGLTYRCCSPACLLYSYAPYNTKISTGYPEEEE